MKHFLSYKKSIITGLLLILGFSSTVCFIPTHKTYAVSSGSVVTDPGNQAVNIVTSSTNVSQLSEQVKEALIQTGKQILSSIAKRILARLTRDTINWINGGFDGKPLFLQDPQGFFVDLRNQEIKNMVNTIGYDPINYPFGRNIAIGLIQGTKNYFAQNAKYSLDQVIGGDQNRVEFQTNFSLGGWGAYTALARPNNNRFGSQLLAKNYYTKITVGLEPSKGESIKAELNQAQGFLSQKKCENPMYDPSDTTEFVANDLNGDGSVDQEETEQQLAQYNEIHVCERWETLTPGKVVSDQIGLALGTKYRQAELGQALGNSISAVFDALINKLVDDGLTALGNATGLTPQQDNFNYMGYTLGTSSINSINGASNSWSSTADIVVDLAEFRNEISNTNPNELGGLERAQQVLAFQEQIGQELSTMPNVIKDLDMCIPGPNRFWQDRIDREFRRETKKLEKKAESKNPKKSQKAIRALRALEYSLEEFKNYVMNSMLLELPSSPLYIDEITNFKNIKEDIQRATEQKLNYKTLIAKINSVKNIINDPSFNPTSLTPGQESVIKNQYKKYLTLRASIPTEEEVSRKELELNKIQENKARIQDITSDCLDERATKGWSSPDARGFATINSGGGLFSKEIELFCTWPISGGYSYGDASEGEVSDNSQSNNGTLFEGEDADEGDGTAYNPNDRFTYILVGPHLQGDGSGYDIPIVNAEHVYKRFLTNVNIDISCDFVFPSTLLDYISDDSGIF